MAFVHQAVCDKQPNWPYSRWEEKWCPSGTMKWESRRTSYLFKQESPKEGAFPKWCLQCFMNALVCWEVQVGLGGDGWSHKEYKVNLDYSLRENSIWMRTGMCSVGNGSLSYFILRSLVIQQRQSGVMNEWKQGAAWHRDLWGGGGPGAGDRGKNTFIYQTLMPPGFLKTRQDRESKWFY